MYVPFCVVCHSTNLVVAPRNSLDSPIRVFCTECRSFYHIREIDVADGIKLVEWRKL